MHFLRSYQIKNEKDEEIRKIIDKFPGVSIHSITSISETSEKVDETIKQQKTKGE